MNFPHEILIDICKYLSLKEISLLPNVYNDEYLWIIKTKHDYGLSNDDFYKFSIKENNNKETYDYFYSEKYTYDELRYLASKYNYYRNKLLEMNRNLIKKLDENTQIIILFPLSLNIIPYFNMIHEYYDEIFFTMKCRKDNYAKIIILYDFHEYFFSIEYQHENGIPLLEQRLNYIEIIDTINKLSINLDIFLKF